jgi:hypothetical protein
VQYRRALNIAILCFAILFYSRAELYAQATDTVGTNEDFPGEVNEDPGEIIIEEQEEEDDGAYHFIPRNDREPVDPPDRRQVPAEKLDMMRKQKGMWYVNVEPEKPKDPAKMERGDYTPLTQRTWFQTLLWILIIGGFGAFLTIYLTGERVGLLRRPAKKMGSDLPEEMPEDIFDIRYDHEVEKAERNGNYRAAVRLLFLKTLKSFTDHGIIHYQEGKTNFDYLVELHPTSYYEKFFRVTRAYEFTWYGKFHLEEPAYALVKKDFDNLNRMIH